MGSRHVKLPDWSHVSSCRIDAEAELQHCVITQELEAAFAWLACALRDI
jgi:hypothetical protein